MSNYKQLILILFLQLCTLVACSDSGITASKNVNSQSDQEATLILDNFTVENYQDRSISWSLSADKAEMFQESNRGLLEVVQIDFFNDEGNKAHRLLADSAESLNNQKTFSCQGNVKILSYDEMINITSNTLLFESNRNQISTDSYIEIQGDSFMITGDGLLFQTITQDVDIHSNIDAKLYVSLN